MGSKIVRGKVDVNSQDFLCEVKDLPKTCLIHSYENHLEGSDHEKVQMLNELIRNHEELQQELERAGVDLPSNSDEMTQFLEDLSESQAQTLYNAIKNLDQ